MNNKTLAMWLVSGGALAYLIGAQIELSMVALFEATGLAAASFCTFLVIRNQAPR